MVSVVFDADVHEEEIDEWVGESWAEYAQKASEENKDIIKQFRPKEVKEKILVILTVCCTCMLCFLLMSQPECNHPVIDGDLRCKCRSWVMHVQHSIFSYP